MGGGSICRLLVQLGRAGGHLSSKPGVTISLGKVFPSPDLHDPRLCNEQITSDNSRASFQLRSSCSFKLETYSKDSAQNVQGLI